MDKLVDLVKLRFEDNLQIYLAHTNRSNHKVTKDMLAMNWGKSDLKAESRLETTNKMCVR